MDESFRDNNNDRIFNKDLYLCVGNMKCSLQYLYQYSECAVAFIKTNCTISFNNDNNFIWCIILHSVWYYNFGENYNSERVDILLKNYPS